MIDTAALADTLAILDSYPKARHIAQRAIEIEDSHAGDAPDQFGFTWQGWEYKDIPCHPAALKDLVAEGLLRIVSQSRRYTIFRLTHADAVRDALVASVDVADALDVAPYTPDDLFSVVVGLDSVKALLWDAIAATDPTDSHVLLEGGPGTAKTLLGEELMRLRPSYCAVGGAASRAGMARVMVGPTPPRWLMVDEIEKGKPQDLSVLLKLMSEGVISLTKHDQIVTKHVPVTVFATCNSSATLPPELVDRFAHVRLEPYSNAEFHAVVMGVMVDRRGLDPEVAAQVAAICLPRTRSVRAVVRIGTLCHGDRRRAAELAEQLL